MEENMKKYLSYIFIIFISISMIACQENPSEESTTILTEDLLDYSDFVDLQVLDYDEQLYHNDDVFYIYYYYEGCSWCQQIKNDVLLTLDRLNEDTVLLFDVEYNSLYLELYAHSSFGVTGTPSLVKVENNQFVEKYTGPSEILPVLNDLN
jgi:thioredoxin-related protein